MTTMPLSPLQSKLLNYCEQVYLLEGNLPSYERAKEVYPELDLNYWQDFFKNLQVKEAFKRRNIAETHKGVLTEQQLLVVNTLLDFTDTRSRNKKLTDLQVSSATYQNWLKDPAFQAYIQRRSEKLLDGNMHEAHLALLNTVRNGDVGAIKLYYEMTGRWSSKTVGDLNVEFLLMKILEVLQKHIRDDVILTNIAEDLANLTGGPGNFNGLEAIKPPAALPVGEASFKESLDSWPVNL